MSTPPPRAVSPGEQSAPRVAVITVVRDEAEMLPRWLSYYGSELGYQSLIVLDDNTQDGSTDDLPCVCYRLPHGPWKAGWGKTRLRMVNGLATALLAVNDVVIYTDVDEFLVPDPALHAGLGAYLAARSESPVVAPLAVEVVHHPGLEPPLDRSQPILAQRSFVKYSPAMCKPHVRRTNSRWHSAMHANASPFTVDPELWMFHLKFADEEVLRKTAHARESVHRLEGRGHPRSFWAMSDDEVAGLLTTWTHGVTDAPDLDPAELDLENLVQRDDDGNWQANANQVASLATTPLRRVPERFRAAL